MVEMTSEGLTGSETGLNILSKAFPFAVVGTYEVMEIGR